MTATSTHNQRGRNEIRHGGRHARPAPSVPQVNDPNAHHPPAPDRTWVCFWCSQPWPCRPAQGRLLAQYDEALESLYMALLQLLEQACRDLPRQPAGALHWQFVGWLQDYASARAREAAAAAAAAATG
ncbi:hypothetical protein [Dactylosporangium sp. CS-033363]|uniref:hypothetical protein n=1 Tax=Dactylosporangium sp. CS-033363 TaxID=3239935 RepID=UPI003D92948C